MNSSSSKISARLNHLITLSGTGDVFWDIGCDHGHVGIGVGVGNRFKRIHFVDPSLPVIEKLKATLDSDIPTHFEFKIIQKKGDEINVTADQNTFLMAGFGGQAMILALKSISPQSRNVADRFILSAHRDNLLLREYLHEDNWELQHEEIFEENAQFYEILIVSRGPGQQKVSLYGEQQWKSVSGQKRREDLLKILPTHQNPLDLKFLEYLRKL